MTETTSGAPAKATKKAAGLRLQRVYTTEGVHPYDQVEWERRDVVMTNWRDGSVNFEQRGVEFPSSWSVNASNIVTTKYFRGAVGTEQREWSLKQVVDRVVETYTRAGVEHGYFATPADAEVFEHELKHMLVHQVFSFNSPVWFNVGTTAPQQVSACQPYDALVATPAGLVPIGELVERDAVGEKVYDAEGVTRILATKCNGTKDVLRLHTKAGYALDVTADHLVWRAGGYGTGSFVPAGELKAGDRLEWHRRDSYGERELLTGEVAEAALAGWLHSDGFVGQYDTGTNRSLTVEAITVNDAELAWVTEAMDAVFGDAHRHEREVVTQDESLDCRRTRLYGEHLRPFVERWGLLERGRDAAVPGHLFAAPQPVVAAYLRSVFQAEGFVSARERSTVVEVDMVGERYVRGLQSLLLRFGIFARVGFKKDERAGRGGGIWSLRIQNDGDRGIFDAEIGFVDERKTEKLLRGFDLPGQPARATKLLEIDRVESLGAMTVYDIQTESGEYLSGNVRVHNCFILSVDDTMDSILNWYKEEGVIFKGGSGAGLNLSRIRSSKELLKSGGTASGPVSFMRGADASAGTIKSGGATRRAAKMVILDVDHPDIEEFVETKANEEKKIRVLRDAGFDMDLGGKDIVSVQYQNANNSVRVTDEFMRAVENAEPFGLKARITGEVLETVDAKGLFRKIATAAWECADPGLQYDDTINDWHTCPETGRITASNPCFPADQRVVTDQGLIRIGDLVERAAAGETFAVYTNDVTHAETPESRIEATIPTQYMVTGTNEVVELRFSDGSRLRCTPGHRVWTQDQGWVHAEDLLAEHMVVKSVLYAARPAADGSLPVAARHLARRAAGRGLALPEKWTEEFAHLLGWLTGDGCLTGSTATLVYGSPEDIDSVLPAHRRLLHELTGFDAKPSVQRNGTVQLRSSKRAVVDFLAALGVSQGTAKDKVVPEAVFTAPEDALVAFLRGLFDADGCVVDAPNGTRYAGLGSRSEELLLGVQELLASLGIAARIYTRQPKTDSFAYTRKDGTEVTYGSDGPSYDLRISGRSLVEFSALVGFTLPRKVATLTAALDEHRVYTTDETVRLVSRTSIGFETTYNLTEPRNHSYVVGGVVVANCSEYMHLDNSSCNLASLNLMKFLREDGSFDAKTFAKVVEYVITAMDISICFADFPTEAIGDTTRAYRQLGIGYANLGALLMAGGLPYDSDSGRAMAGAITSLMQATAYKRSAELAGIVGPYAGYARNADAHQRVVRKHAAANDALRPFGADDARILHEATRTWQECQQIGGGNGYRNSQASVIAPTGCLTGDTMVTTDRGLSRLDQLGDVYGPKWQDVDFAVSTDEGARRATKFFVNGEEPTRRIVTEGGYTIQGTLAHRVKVVDAATGEWQWKRLADVAPGDVVPVQMDTLVGEPRRVPLPVLDQAYYAGDRSLVVPEAVDTELAELVGYFMGDGSLHAKGIRLCVADTDLDVVDRLRVLAKGLFGIEAAVTANEGYQEVRLDSVRLARWWQAAGFAKTLPSDDHVGKGWVPRVPAAILESNDKAVYAAFLRGLFEADGTVQAGVPSVSTASRSFAAEVQALLLTLGLPSTLRTTPSGFGVESHQVRVRNNELAVVYGDVVGFLGDRKARGLASAESVTQTGNRDLVRLPRPVWDEVVPVGHALRDEVLQNVRRAGGVPRSTAERLYRETRDARLRHALDYVFETVSANDDGGIQPTYDLSVPENVTYVANGFVSHNTIGLMMDCDTTGLEPDLALVKNKKLVGGASMKIVNGTVPAALRKLGYDEEIVEAIVEYIAEHGHVVDAPGLRPEHYAVFDCAMGERSISWMGHIRMMAAIQPFISGALSKTVNLPESASVEDIEKAYFEAWKLGLKAIAVYRNNCKVGQPLSDINDTKKAAAAQTAAMEPHEHRPVRKRLPKKRPSQTVSFSVGGAEGYMIASNYPDDGLGELFIKMSKQGSTLAGVMDAFSIAISIALQYGVPLETYVAKFTNMRFDPAGMTDDPDVRMAQSVMDYIFRRLALDYLPYDKRAELGIFTLEERTASVASSYGSAPADVAEVDVEGLAQSVPVEAPAVTPALAPGAAGGGGIDVSGQTAQDAPLCMSCGIKMRPAGSCYVCESCGSTSGCS